MYSIEVTSGDLKWIAAIYEAKTDGNTYLNDLKSHGHTFDEINLTHITSFPVYAVEHVTEGAPTNTFTYHTEPEYLDLIKHQQKNRSPKATFEAYFTVYLFSSPYFQHPYGHSLMGALDHVHVDDYFLDSETATLGLGSTYIDRMVDQYNLEALYALYDTLKNSADEEAKQELSDGLLQLFANMDYDYACGKLTTMGIDALLPILEKASSLSGESIPEYYSRAYLILLEEAIKNRAPKKVVQEYMDKAVEVNESILHATQEEEQEAYSNLALTFKLVLEYLPSAEYLQKAFSHIKKSIALDVTEGDWSLYLKLILIPVDASDPLIRQNIETLQADERIHFETFAKDHFAQNINLGLTISRSMHTVKDYIEWSKLPETLFPEQWYTSWLEKALLWQMDTRSRIALTENAHYLHNEGVRLQRIDLLEKAALLYQKLVEIADNPAFEIYYLANNAEALSDVYLHKGDKKKAYAYRNISTDIYENNFDIIRANFSTHLHYTEYLLRNFYFDGPINKSTIEQIEKHAQLAENEANGMYSKPAMIRLQLALHENKEEKATFLMARQLLLHESCMDKEVDKLLETSNETQYPTFFSFLKETEAFMHAIRENFYLDPTYKWKDICNMTPEDVMQAWQERKMELMQKFAPKSSL